MSAANLPDPGIKTLVEAMNKTGWLITVSSCEGHNGGSPYVALYCRMNKIGYLARVLDTVEHDYFPVIMFECCLIHESEVLGSQGDAPAGWVALNLKFNLLHEAETGNCTVKKMVFDLLAQRLC